MNFDALDQLSATELSRARIDQAKFLAWVMISHWCKIMTTTPRCLCLLLSTNLSSHLIVACDPWYMSLRSHMALP